MRGIIYGILIFCGICGLMGWLIVRGAKSPRPANAEFYLGLATDASETIPNYEKAIWMAMLDDNREAATRIYMQGYGASEEYAAQIIAQRAKDGEREPGVEEVKWAEEHPHWLSARRATTRSSKSAEA